MCRRLRPLPACKDEQIHADRRLDKLESTVLNAGAVDLAILACILSWASHNDSRRFPAATFGAVPRAALA